MRGALLTEKDRKIVDLDDGRKEYKPLYKLILQN